MSDNTIAEAGVVSMPFSIKKTMAEGWSLTQGYKWAFHVPLAMAGAIVILAVLLVELPVDIYIESQGATAGAAGVVALFILSRLISAAMTSPVNAGVILMGVGHAREKGVKRSLMWSAYRRTPALLLQAIIRVIMIMAGMMLLVLPGIYLFVAYLFCPTVLVERRCGPWEALEISRRAITPHWFRVAGLVLVVGLVNFLAMIPLGLGLIWSAPWSVATLGVAYRDLLDSNQTEKTWQTEPL